MENKIKELIEKYEEIIRKDKFPNLDPETEVYGVVKDLQSLLKLYKSQQDVAPESEPLGNGIKKVYERFQHLDRILSDPESMLVEDDDRPEGYIDPIYATCYELWKAVKNER